MCPAPSLQRRVEADRHTDCSTQETVVMAAMAALGVCVSVLLGHEAGLVQLLLHLLPTFVARLPHPPHLSHSPGIPVYPYLPFMHK